ncbi:MAG: helix-turn-helix domain-containing protein [Bacteroidales bacterium]|nr:helix-turn-helix domain-containing protein [Bacteroidales bacterium]
MENSPILSRLKAIRLTLGMNQKEFGERMGMALTTWASIEQGRNSFNERARLLLEKIYYVNPEFLDTGNGPMFLRPSQTEENDFFAPPSNFDPGKAMNLQKPDPPGIRRSMKRNFDPEFTDAGISFYSAMESNQRYVPCPECHEKDLEIRRLRQMIERLEAEADHQRKVIDHLMEMQRNQQKPI